MVLRRSIVFIEEPRQREGTRLRRACPASAGSPVFYAVIQLIYPFKQMLLLVRNSKLVKKLVVFFSKCLFPVMFFLVQHVFAHPVNL